MKLDTSKTKRMATAKMGDQRIEDVKDFEY